MTEDSALEAIRYNVDLIAGIAREHLGTEPDFGEATVRWLDGFIERQHERGDKEKHAGLVQTLGSFFGECIVRTYGGTWAHVDDRWAVRFDERNCVFPFTKVQKHLANGSEDSVLSLFTVIPRSFRGKLPPKPSAS
jgi:hypothetical protein